MSQQPSGWYDDPSNPDQLRYWDGVTWTNHTAPRRSPTVAQPTQPTQPVGGDQQVPTAPLPQAGDRGSEQYPAQYPAQYGQQQGAGQYPSQYPTQHPGAGRYPGAGQYPGTQQWLRGPVTADGVPLAAWGKRLGAWLIDGVLIFVVGGTLGWLGTPRLGALFGSLGDAVNANDQAAVEAITQEMTGSVLQISVIMWLFATAYCLFFWTTVAQTPGKMALGISVRAADRPGTLTIGTALLRRLVPLAGQLVPFLTILDGLWPLWDQQRQALHDKVAKTVVVEGKQPRRQG